jgi:hypothetical protein
MPKQEIKTVVIVCPEFAWRQIEATLQTALRAANFDQETRAAIAKAYEALTLIEGPNAAHLFGSQIRSIIIRGWESTCRLWGRLIVQDNLLVAVLSLPDDEYQFFVREDRAAALEEALNAIGARDQGAQKEPAPGVSLADELAARVSAPGA